MRGGGVTVLWDKNCPVNANKPSGLFGGKQLTVNQLLLV